MWSTALLALVISTAACEKNTAEQAPINYAPIVYVSGLPWIQDAQGYWYLIDTGAPRTLIAPHVLGRSPDAFEETVLDPIEWQLPGGIDASETAVVVVAPPPQLVDLFSADGLGGIVGVDLLANQQVTFDPLNRQFTLGGPIPGDGGESVTQVDVALRGGGTTCFGSDARCAEFPATRLVVQAEIEGQRVQALLDTGAANVSISKDLFERLPVATDRPYFEIRTQSAPILRGSRTSSLRIADVKLGNVAISIFDFDDDIAKLQVETGANIEMILGESFLQNFAMTVDYREPALYLAQYDTQAHIIEDYTGLSFGVEEAGDCYSVRLLIPMRDAWNKGLEFGDCVVSLGDDHEPGGGEALDTFWEYVDTLPVGESVAIEVQREEEIIPLNIAIENMLPTWR